MSLPILDYIAQFLRIQIHVSLSYALEQLSVLITTAPIKLRTYLRT